MKKNKKESEFLSSGELAAHLEFSRAVNKSLVGMFQKAENAKGINILSVIETAKNIMEDVWDSDLTAGIKSEAIALCPEQINDDDTRKTNITREEKHADMLREKEGVSLPSEFSQKITDFVEQQVKERFEDFLKHSSTKNTASKEGSSFADRASTPSSTSRHK